MDARPGRRPSGSALPVRSGGLSVTHGYWCECAWTGEGERAEHGVLVEVDAGRITAVRRRPAPPDGVERLTGLTLPGLANAHSHAFHRALRGRTHAGGGPSGPWGTWSSAFAVRWNRGSTDV